MGLIDILGKVDDVASWTANPPPDRPIAGAVGAAMQKVCDSFANVPDWAKEAARNTPGGQQGIPGALGVVCKPYWDGAGVDGPDIAVPFTGGQCPGTTYRIRGSYSATLVNCSDGNEIPVSNTLIAGRGNFQVVGPVLSLTAEKRGATCRGIEQDVGILAVHNGGQTTSYFRLEFDPAGQVAFRLNSLSPVLDPQGGDDDCGDPEGELVPGANPPPDPGPLTPEETPTFDPSNPTGAPIPIPDIPSLPGFPDLPIDDDAIGGGPGAAPPPAGGDGLPGLPDAAADPAGAVNGDGDGEDVPFGDPPAGRIWVGCVVTATVDSRLGNIAGTAPASTVYPQVIGNVALKHGDFYSSSVPIRSRFQDLFRKNSALIVNGCFIHARPGVSLSVRPISAVTCPENPCGDP